MKRFIACLIILGLCPLAAPAFADEVGPLIPYRTRGHAKR